MRGILSVETVKKAGIIRIFPFFISVGNRQDRAASHGSGRQTDPDQAMFVTIFDRIVQKNIDDLQVAFFSCPAMDVLVDIRLQRQAVLIDDRLKILRGLCGQGRQVGICQFYIALFLRSRDRDQVVDQDRHAAVPFRH